MKCLKILSKNLNLYQDIMKEKIKKSALTEIKGVDAPAISSSVAATRVQSFRKIIPSADDLIKGIVLGQITALSRAITLIESTNIEHFDKANQIINACLLHSNKSVRIGDRKSVV